MEYIDIIIQKSPVTLAEQLRYKRIQLGLTQKGLANHLGVSREVVMRLENNKNISMKFKVHVIKSLFLLPNDRFTAFLCGDFGNYIMKKRIFLDLTQKELAGKLGVSRKTIRLWEKEHSMPSYENYCKLTRLIDLNHM